MAYAEIDEWILDRHVKIILSTYDDVFEQSDGYNMRCDFCGDSKSDQYKKSAYILKNKTPWVYYCHKGTCGTSTTVIKWMKEYHPSQYQKMMMDVMQNRKHDPRFDNKEYKFKKKSSMSDRDEKEDIKFFKSIMDYSDCVDWCEDRMIPKEVYSKWKYATGGIYSGRIMIYFYHDGKGKPYYYQGRAFDGGSLKGVKYLSRFGDYNSIYNFYNVNPDLPVIILEGPIDSIFVENSIAVTGLKLKDSRLDKFTKQYFMVDNDNAGYKTALKLLKQRKYVFNWQKFLKDHRCDGKVKDVNDFVLKNIEGITELTWELVEPYFTNKMADKMWFPYVDTTKKKKKVNRKYVEY